MSALFSLTAYYGLFVLLLIFVQVLLAVPQLGLPYLFSSRDEGRTTTGMAARAERAVSNSIGAMALFAPAALILHGTGAESETMVLAGQIFLAARIAYVLCYLFGLIYLRTLTWLTGFFATAYLYLMVLS